MVKYSIWVQGEWQTKMLSADEVENLLKEKFAEVISSKNKGVIMKTVMPELKGKADGKIISEVDAFSGALIELAEKHCILVPVNRYLNRRAKEIEIEYIH